MGVQEMAQQAKALSTMIDNLSSVLGTQHGQKNCTLSSGHVSMCTHTQNLAYVNMTIDRNGGVILGKSSVTNPH